MRKWLKRLFGIEDQPPGVAPAEVLTMMTNAYQRGLAEGELKGRLDLATELEIAYGIASGHDLKEEDVKNLRTRQVH